MGLIDQLQVELKDALVEHQALVLVHVLRKRFDTLTLGDLRTILASRLGRGLDPVLVRDLVAPAAPAAPKPRPTRRARKRTKKAGMSAAQSKPETRTRSDKEPARTKTKSSAKTKKKASKAQTTNSKRVGEAQPPKVSALTVAGREQYDGALAQYLREHPGYNKPLDIRAAVGGTKLQFRIAMQRLEEKGQAQRQGSHSTTRYAAKA